MFKDLTLSSFDIILYMCETISESGLLFFSILLSFCCTSSLADCGSGGSLKDAVEVDLEGIRGEGLGAAGASLWSI